MGPENIKEYCENYSVTPEDVDRIFTISGDITRLIVSLRWAQDALVQITDSSVKSAAECKTIAHETLNSIRGFNSPNDN